MGATTFLDIVEGESATMEELDALYDFLPMTLEEIRVLRDFWFNAATGLNVDPLGVPPPNERPYLYYLVIRGMADLESPARAAITEAALADGRPRHVEIVVEEDGSWTLYLGYIRRH